MIDIFVEEVYVSPFLLMAEAGMEMGRYLLNLAVLILLYLLAKRCGKQKPLKWSFLLAMPLCQAVTVWVSGSRSEFIYAGALAFLLTAQLYLLQAVCLHWEDFFFFFSALFIPTRLFNSTSALLGDLWLFWLVFAICYLTVKMARGKIAGCHFGCYLSFVSLSLCAYLFRLFVFCVPELLAPVLGSIASFLLTVLTALAGLLFGAGCVRKHLGGHIQQFNRLGGSYPKLERAFFLSSVVTLTVCTLVFLPFTFFGEQNPLVLLLFPSLCITFLFVQLALVLMLFHVEFYRDSARLEQAEKQSLSDYYSNLTDSLNTMREMRHDMKNIFFTMGSFVDRSDDAQMKAFFWEKIYPYSVDSIRQSELLSAIYQIPNESLRAFFYLKLSQAVQRKIRVSLTVSLEDTAFQPEMDIIDLTRVLGILLDNAIEEVETLPEGDVEVRVSGKDGRCSFSVRNTVSEDTMRRGIHAGQSRKGSGHGNGLMILRQIVGRYPNAVLNSLLQGDRYIQSLNL